MFKWIKEFWPRLKLRAELRHETALEADLQRRVDEALGSLLHQRDAARIRIRGIRAKLHKIEVPTFYQ